ncbi:MAG: hypothetical protein ACJAWS_001265 [Oleiphilaceae bacterium]|jgi:hypothetical protein
MISLPITLRLLLACLVEDITKDDKGGGFFDAHEYICQQNY